MISTLYIEESIRSHPRTKIISDRYPQATKIFCNHYGEVFNRKSQNFRIQKDNPALILAKKTKNLIMKAPDHYGIGSNHNYYFSHMLNCLYDCRYCFLQGMYRSAAYVLFVNYEDFMNEIISIQNNIDAECYFFSGYDCDSLALEPVTKFAEEFLPIFRDIPNAWLELRTKSTQIRTLLEMPVLEKCIVAFSLSPESITKTLEHKTPTLEKRLNAIKALQEKGWKIGLRFDPVIYQEDYVTTYSEFFNQVFQVVDKSLLHSVSIGTFRMPASFFENIVKLRPKDDLFSGPVYKNKGNVSYKPAIENEILEYCTKSILRYVPEKFLYTCME